MADGLPPPGGAAGPPGIRPAGAGAAMARLGYVVNFVRRSAAEIRDRGLGEVISNPSSSLCDIDMGVRVLSFPLSHYSYNFFFSLSSSAGRALSLRKIPRSFFPSPTVHGTIRVRCSDKGALAPRIISHRPRPRATCASPHPLPAPGHRPPPAAGPSPPAMAPAPPAASSAGGCIDLSHPDQDEVARRIADACGTWGFFQVTGHGIPPGLVGEFRAASAAFFALPGPAKDALRRDGTNARGYFDDELTKQRRDWKEALDVGAPGGGDWSLPDGHPSNACLDGYNRFPPEEVLPGYRDTVVRYFGACEGLADRIAVLMARGLGADAGAGAGAGADGIGGPLLARMRSRHTSYLRTNYYPPYVPGETAPADPASLPPSASPPTRTPAS